MTAKISTARINTLKTAFPATDLDIVEGQDGSTTFIQSFYDPKADPRTCEAHAVLEVEVDRSREVTLTFYQEETTEQHRANGYLDLLDAIKNFQRAATR